MKMSWLGLLILMALLPLLIAQVQRADTIIAIVNEDAITYGELVQQAKPYLMAIENSDMAPERKILEQQKVLRSTLDNMIDERLILQEAKRYNINISDKTVREKMEEQQLQNQGAIVDSGEVDFSELMRSRLTLQELFQKKTSYSPNESFRAVIDTFVSPMEIRYYYEKNLQKEFSHEHKIKTRLITLFYSKNNGRQETLVLAREIVNQVRAGKDFGEMAKQYSNDRYAKEGGTWPRLMVDPKAKAETEAGSPQTTSTEPPPSEEPQEVWGFFGKSKGQDDALLKEVEVVAFSLKAGEISDPIELDAGTACQIVKVEAVQPGGVTPFTEIQEQVRQKLRAQKIIAALTKMRDRLRTKAFIWFAKN